MALREGSPFFLILALAFIAPGDRLTFAQTEPAPSPAPATRAAASAPVEPAAPLPAASPNPAPDSTAASSADAVSSPSAPAPAPIPADSAPNPPASAPVAVVPAPPLKPKAFVEPPPPAPTNCPAIAAAVYGAAGEVRDADFFPGEERIVYISTKSGAPQLYMQDLNRAPATGKLPPVRALPKMSLDLRGVRVYPDGNALLLTVRLSGGMHALHKLTLNKTGGKPEPLPREPGSDAVFIRWSSSGVLLYSETDAKGGSRLRGVAQNGEQTPAFLTLAGGESIAAVSADLLNVVTTQDDAAGHPLASLISLPGRKRITLSWPGAPPRHLRVLEFSEDHHALRLLADPGREQLALYAWPLTGKPPVLLAERDEGFLQAGTLGVNDWLVQRSGGRAVLSLSLAGSDFPLKLEPHGGGFLVQRVSATGGRALLRATGEGHPGDLWLYSDPDHEPLRLTDLRNPAIASGCDAAAAPVAPDPDDPALTGWLYEPKKIHAGLILLPDAPGPGFRPQYDGRINYFVSRGFLVLALNRRGTDCCGASWAFADGFASDAGLLEVAAAREYLLGVGVPENRIALWGEGTGGTLALRAMQSSPRDYAAGVIIGAPVDLAAWRASLRASLPGGGVCGRLVKALGEPGAARKRSPLFCSLTQSPPLIILHGADDEIVPVSQAESLVEELIASGRTVAFHVFEGANHAIDRPGDRAGALSSAGKFLRRHVLMKAAPKKP